MNKNNVDIVVQNICCAFDDMRIPTAMGIDVLKLGLDSSAELTVKNPKENMRKDFLKVAGAMREMFLDGTDGITNEEIDEGFNVLVKDAETFLRDGPNEEQQAMMDLMNAVSGSGHDKSNSTLH